MNAEPDPNSSQNPEPPNAPLSQPAALDSVEPPLTRRQRRLMWWLCGGAFFVSYVLSAGPAVFVMRRFDQPMITAVLELIYAPLVFLVKNQVPVVGPVIKTYIQLFD